MTSSINISAGLDIHNKFVLATILWSTGQLIQERFDRTKDGILSLKSWIMLQKCEVVACESTSDFWVPIYDLINDSILVIVGNARDIKALSHKKTDKVDSEMIARLALHGMIQPSRVFCGEHREFRKICRIGREKLPTSPLLRTNRATFIAVRSSTYLPFRVSARELRKSGLTSILPYPSAFFKVDSVNKRIHIQF